MIKQKIKCASPYHNERPEYIFKDPVVIYGETVMTGECPMCNNKIQIIMIDSGEETEIGE